MAATLKKPSSKGGEEYVAISPKGIMMDAPDMVDIHLALSNSHPDVEVRYRDMAFFHTLIDAHRSGEMILVGKNVFREEDKHPYPDRLSFDRKLAVRLLRR